MSFMLDGMKIDMFMENVNSHISLQFSMLTKNVSFNIQNNTFFKYIHGHFFKPKLLISEE